MTWQETQTAAIAAQKAAHAALVNGGELLPASDDGPLATYTRAQTLDYVAQLRNILAAGTYLPSPTGPGLTILPGTKRDPIDAETTKKLTGVLARLEGNFTDKELAEADARLATNLENGVTLDPATAESV